MDRKGLRDRARAAAAALGGRRRRSHGGSRGAAAAVDEGRPPAWLAELDEYRDADELAFTLYSDLEEVVSARTGVTVGSERDE